jgi:hypothetical protein
MVQSSCGEECRRTANFYMALRWCEVFGLASAQRTAVSQASSLVILNLLHYRTANSCRRLLTIQNTKNTRFTKTLCFPYYEKTKHTCRNVCIYVCQ